MYRCVCGNVLGESQVTVTRKPCRCGLADRKVTPGAPHIWWPARNKERERVGLPDKTDSEKAIDSRWV